MSETMNNLLKTSRPFKNLEINWKLFYEIIDKNYLQNDMLILSPGGTMQKKLFGSVKMLIGRLRNYFSDNSV